MLLPILISLVAAAIPTLVYVLLFYWADRYEREPRWLAIVAFGWGAVPAIVVSVLGELLIGGAQLGIAGAQSILVGSVLIAPLVEETAKWVALLAIFIFKRQEFDGPLDGLVYGALIGFGFAMTENLLFFLGAYRQGGYEALSTVFVIRAIIFGMNHAFYTALAGIAMGIARDVDTPRARILWIGAGLLLAIVAHSLHNLGASMRAAGGDFTLSLTVTMASLTLIVLTVLWSWQHERAILETELAGEVNHALTPDEFATLISRWRRPTRRDRFVRIEQTPRQQLAVELALRKHRQRRQGEPEPEVTREIVRLRTLLMSGME